MPGITLNELLEAKEKRAGRRRTLQAGYPGTCISLSLNIPGAEKDSARIRALFRHAEARVEETFPVLVSLSVLEKTGPHTVFAVAGEPGAAKEAACRLENESPYAHLFDLDVYDNAGNAVSLKGRGTGRACFVCDGPAVVCMREARHSLQEIAAAVDKLFIAFHADMSRRVSPSAEYYASLGLEAMLLEAASSPSPGLVDPFHSGSHKDMDFFTFQRSSAALAFSLARCCEAGIWHDGEPGALLPVLRCIGIEAEKDMLRATGGVNTQKGLLFSLGLVLGVTGLLIRDGKPAIPENVSETIRRMTAGLVARELEPARLSPRTAGERMYRDYGISGIRGEMEAGLPSVLDADLPALENALAEGAECNRALIGTLIALMAVVDDTTILARAPVLQNLRAVQARARDLLASGRLDSADWQNALWELDAELARRNISPGGSADMLALTWYMHRARSGPTPLPHPRLSTMYS